MKHITLITGGCRSGKSDYALQLAEGFRHRVFIATAEAVDEEMRRRIARHRQRRGAGFVTLEEPLDLAPALEGVPEAVEVVVVDCLTVWLGNLMYRRQVDSLEAPEIARLLDVLERTERKIVLVSNEVGMGIVPGDALSRRFRDLAGGINQRVGALADQVVLMVSGQPLVVKGAG